MNKDRKKIISIICIVVFSVAAVYAAIRAYLIYAEYHTGEVSYVNLVQYVNVPPEASEAPEEEQTITFPEIDFDSLREVNSEIVGWIYCEDTVINYPIVQADNNDYYMDHLFDGKYNSSGCIFLDYRNSSNFSDRNNIIYGHHMRNGSMFAGLTGYRDQKYYEDHPQFLLVTPQQNYVVEVFAGYVTDVEDEAWKLDFDSDQDYLAWLEERMEKSAFKAEITPAADDKVLTLSTCTYEFDDARFVLFGILHEEM